MASLFYLFETKLKPQMKEILKKRNEKDDFEHLLLTHKETWEKLLPPEFLSQLYDGENGKKLDDLTFLQLIYLFYLLSDKLDIVRSEVELLDSLLLKAYCQHHGVLEEDFANQRENTAFSLFLERMGVETADVENAFEENDHYDMGEDTAPFVESLDKDEVFQNRFLRCFKIEKARREANGEVLPVEWSQFVEKLKKIETQGQVDLDSLHNMRSTLKREIGSLLECHFCNNQLSQARTLPCLHSFCTRCLKSHLNKDEKIVICPICQRRISVPDEEYVDTMPCGFVTSGLAEFYEKTLRSSDSNSCAMCILPASQYNLKTGQPFCGIHSAPVFHLDQKIEPRCIPIMELLNKDKITGYLNQFCPQHEGILQKFCTYCQVPTCNDSACITWHGQHGDLKPLPEVVNDQKKDLQQISVVLEKKLDKISSKIHLVETNQVHVADLQENIRESISKYFKDMEVRLTEKKLEFFKDLDKAAELSWHQDEQTRQNLSGWKEKAQVLRDEIVSVTAPPETGSAVMSYPMTTLALQRQRLLDLIGDTAGGSTLSENKAISYPEGHLRTLLQGVANLSSQITASNTARGWEIAARTTGLRYFLATEHKLLVIRRALLTGSQIQGYDIHNLGSEPTTQCEGGVHDFQAVAINSRGELVIPHETQTNLELPGLKMKKSVNLVNYPGVPMQPANNLAVINVQCLNTYAKVLLKAATVSDYQGKRTKMFIADDQCIVEMNEKGQVNRKFAFYTMVNISDFAPDMTRDILAVTDATKHKLLIFNCRSHQIQTVGSQGVTPGQLNYPSGVDIDPYGHIFVADPGNARIQVFDLNGKFLKLIQYPQSLRDVAAAPNSQLNAQVVLQVSNDYLYIFDNRMETIWRIKYM